MTLLAQADQATFTAVVAGLASVGFSVWYGWYVTTKTLPAMTEQFREEQKESRATFERTLDKIADRFVCQSKD